MIVFGLMHANPENWSAEHGGFLPYGTKGVFAGAASCFFAYIGFDGIATSGEEAANPSKSIPRATLISMSIVTFAYVLMASALTLMVPYDLIHPSAAFADAFEEIGANWAKYVVAVGALSGMTTSLFGSLFALPRCVYAMASDGLIFSVFGFVHQKSQTPIVAVSVFGGTTAIIAMLFDVETLVQFLSIGTLMAYTIVSSSVIILRYRPEVRPEILQTDGNENSVSSSENDRTGLVAEDPAGQLKAKFRNFRRLENFCDRFDPGSLVTGSVFAMIFLMFVIGAILNYGDLDSWHCVLALIFFSIGVFFCLLLIYAHEPSKITLSFKVILIHFNSF